MEPFCVRAEYFWYGNILVAQYIIPRGRLVRKNTLYYTSELFESEGCEPKYKTASSIRTTPYRYTSIFIKHTFVGAVEKGYAFSICRRVFCLRSSDCERMVDAHLVEFLSSGRKYTPLAYLPFEQVAQFRIMNHTAQLAQHVLCELGAYCPLATALDTYIRRLFVQGICGSCQCKTVASIEPS